MVLLFDTFIQQPSDGVGGNWREVCRKRIELDPSAKGRLTAINQSHIAGRRLPLNASVVEAAPDSGLSALGFLVLAGVSPVGLWGLCGVLKGRLTLSSCR